MEAALCLATVTCDTDSSFRLGPGSRATARPLVLWISSSPPGRAIRTWVNEPSSKSISSLRPASPSSIRSIQAPASAASPMNGRRMKVFMRSGAIVSANPIAGSGASSQKGKARVGTRSSPRAEALPGRERSQSVHFFVPVFSLTCASAASRLKPTWISNGPRRCLRE